MPKLLIGFISFKDLHYLKVSMPHLEQLAQRFEAKVCVIDTAGDDAVKDFLEKNYADIDFFRHEDGNIGFGRGHSEILRRNPGFDYYLGYQPDIWLDEDALAEVIMKMEQDESLALCSGKLHYWDFDADKKTNQIDSLGIWAEKRHHFHDLGQGQVDEGQYDDKLDEVLGVSGALFLVRTSVIPQLHGSTWQLFDERMWMYKEDIDLSYRLRELGHQIKIFPKVIAWHARTVSNREGQNTGGLLKAGQSKADYARRHSYKNHILLLKNHLRLSMGFQIWARTLFFETLKSAYMMVFHPTVFWDGLKVLLSVPAKKTELKVPLSQVSAFFH